MFNFAQFLCLTRIELP